MNDVKIKVNRVIAEARDACESLIGEHDWLDAVEAKIFELSDSEEVAEQARVEHNLRVFRAAGVI